MMAAYTVYRWDYINPYATVSVFVHGFSPKVAMVYSITPYVENSNWPNVAATLTQGQTYVHVDGTWARLATVQSNFQGPMTVDLNVLHDEIG
jgi:hypothetical protein